MVSLARDQDDVWAAQRLRHLVFAGELGARLDGPEPGLDVDPFDAYCDHLLVREQNTGDVVGTYRLLPPEAARAAGRIYFDSEFDLSRLARSGTTWSRSAAPASTPCTAPVASSP